MAMPKAPEVKVVGVFSFFHHRIGASLVPDGAPGRRPETIPHAMIAFAMARVPRASGCVYSGLLLLFNFWWHRERR